MRKVHPLIAVLIAGVACGALTTCLWLIMAYLVN